VISKKQLLQKRAFDFLLSVLLLLILIVPIVFLVLLSTLDSKQFGIFSQLRVGQNGNLFRIYKLRTLKNETHKLGQLNTSATKFGKFLRNSKLDELPQLYNVLIGDMSFVGPRPDVPGFADKLTGEDRIILIRTIIWVDKVEINKKYVLNWSFYLDLNFITKSILN